MSWGLSANGRLAIINLLWGKMITHDDHILREKGVLAAQYGGYFGCQSAPFMNGGKSAQIAVGKYPTCGYHV